MSDETPIDPVPPAVEQVLALFDERLRELRFPDVDREQLASKAESVREQAAELHRLRAELDAARREMEARQHDLLAMADKGVAYAQVFAREDEELRRELDALALSRERRGRSRRQRRRPTKAEAVAASQGEEPARSAEDREPARVVAELPLVAGVT